MLNDEITVVFFIDIHIYMHYVIQLKYTAERVKFK